MSNIPLSKLEISGNQIERVVEYTYLGQTISFEEKINKELSQRIAKAWRNYWALKHFYKSKKASLKLKRKILEQCTVPALLYGAQTWTLTLSQVKRFQITQRRMERSILNLRIKDRIPIKTIRERTKIKGVSYLVKSMKFRYV